MRARKYNKRIEVWQTEKVSDGVGGFTNPTETLLSSSWCQIVTLDKVGRSTDFGITDFNDTIVIRLRKRNDLPYNSKNQFFIYRNQRYIPQNEPINVGFQDKEIQITLKRQSVKGVQVLQPIIGFPYTLPFKLA